MRSELLPPGRRPSVAGPRGTYPQKDLAQRTSPGWRFGATGRRRRVVTLLALLGALLGIGVGMIPASRQAADPAKPPAAFGLKAPAGFTTAQLRFSDTFGGMQLATSRWSSYIASAGSAGIAWNSNGHGGSSLDRQGRFSNLEYDLPSQVHVAGGLTLLARRVATPGMLGDSPRTYSWRSGAVSTVGKFSLDGGYVQIEALMPSASGMWPGLWLLPAPGTASHSDNFEVDMFEGGYLGTASATSGNFAWALHTPSVEPRGVINTGVDLSANYHVYGLDWIPGKSLTWYFDNRRVAQVTSTQAPIPDEPMELIMNLGVAGSGAGSFHSLTGPTAAGSGAMVVHSVQIYE